jgi:hypothetical protein
MPIDHTYAKPGMMDALLPMLVQGVGGHSWQHGDWKRPVSISELSRTLPAILNVVKRVDREGVVAPKRIVVITPRSVRRQKPTSEWRPQNG